MKKHRPRPARSEQATTDNLGRWRHYPTRPISGLKQRKPSVSICRPHVYVRANKTRQGAPPENPSPHTPFHISQLSDPTEMSAKWRTKWQCRSWGRSLVCDVHPRVSVPSSSRLAVVPLGGDRSQHVGDPTSGLSWRMKTVDLAWHRGLSLTP
jgi:hypothetical protein